MTDVRDQEPPWWHQELVDRVQALDGKVDQLQADIQQVRGIMRLLTAVGTFLLVAATVAGPIILAVHS